MARPFNEDEKRFLLTEVLKASKVPLTALLSVVRDEAVAADWFEICLPPARNVNDCQAVFNELLSNSASSVPLQFPNDYGYDIPGSSSRKRRREEEEPVVPVARALKPKPATTNGDQPSLLPATPTPGSVPKKRGRPSNADLAARKAEAALRGEVVSIAKKALGRKPSGAKALQPALVAGTDGASEVNAEGNPESPTLKKVRRRRQSVTKNSNTAESEPSEETGPVASEENVDSIEAFNPTAEDEGVLDEAEAGAGIDAMETTQEVPDSAAETHTITDQSVEV